MPINVTSTALLWACFRGGYVCGIQSGSDCTTVYTGYIQMIEREDGSGLSYNVRMQAPNGVLRTFWCQFEH